MGKADHQAERGAGNVTEKVEREDVRKLLSKHYLGSRGKSQQGMIHVYDLSPSEFAMELVLLSYGKKDRPD